jgi:hypothetical protein
VGIHLESRGDNPQSVVDVRQTPLIASVVNILICYLSWLLEESWAFRKNHSIATLEVADCVDPEEVPISTGILTVLFPCC